MISQVAHYVSELGLVWLQAPSSLHLSCPRMQELKGTLAPQSYATLHCNPKSLTALTNTHTHAYTVLLLESLCSASLAQALQEPIQVPSPDPKHSRGPE
eukprot:1157787-Pelagomonas_calceolata.AAC.1